MAVHCGTGVDNFYAVNIHDTPLIVDMGAADQIKGPDVAPDTLASDVFAIDFIERLIGRGMGKKDIVYGFFHLLHCTL